MDTRTTSVLRHTRLECFCDVVMRWKFYEKIRFGISDLFWYCSFESGKPTLDRLPWLGSSGHDFIVNGVHFE